MTETTRRIIELKEKMGLKDRQLEIEARLKPAFLQAWKNGKKNTKGELVEVNPSVDSIIKLAQYFNVSADYLLCLTDDPKPLKTANIIDRPTATLAPVLAELSKDRDFVNSAKLYRAIDNEYQKQICAYILGVATTLGVNIAQVLGK